jgi:hypothetical protein
VAGHVTRLGKIINVNKVLAGKSEGKRLLEDRCRWEINVETDLK